MLPARALILNTQSFTPTLLLSWHISHIDTILRKKISNHSSLHLNTAKGVFHVPFFSKMSSGTFLAVLTVPHPASFKSQEIQLKLAMLQLQGGPETDSRNWKIFASVTAHPLCLGVRPFFKITGFSKQLL